VRRARTIASVCGGLALFSLIPTWGWAPLWLMALSALNTETLDARTARSQRPEYHAAFSVLWSQCIVAAAVILTGGPRSLALPLIAVPTAFAAARFRPAAVMLGVATAVALLLAATLGVDARQTLAHPDGLVVAVAVLAGISAVVHALSGAEAERRNESILDPLTGLLNRLGLRRRFDELAEQARLTDNPISLLICDIDNFKKFNDEFGHARGDAILSDVAEEIRNQLRSFELIYRIGGEEFMVVLPGAPAAEADRLAKHLRQAIEQTLKITISTGVSTAYGRDVQYEPLFQAADHALYAAKASGRNRVLTAPVLPPDRHVNAVPSPRDGLGLLRA
jgi:diguanylate cyclase (GGDEF)-like protein